MSMLMRCIALFFCLFWLSWAHADQALISTVTLNAWDLHDTAEVAKKLQKSGFNHVTLYVPWGEVEPQEGEFRFEKFDDQIGALAKEGLKFILVLDFGGRPFLDDAGRNTHRSIIPEWFLLQHGDAMMQNFSAEPTKQIGFLEPKAQRLTSRFVEKSVHHFAHAHPGVISGFAIGLQEEHEIKYGQEGYQWRDYGRNFIDRFHSRFDSAPPVINYNNEIAQFQPRREPHFFDLLALRDEDLRNAICHYESIIRRYHQTAVAYFGEFFTSHDAIYGGGVVENLGSCVDIAVVDFNFYDGYRLKNDPNILPLMVNYLANNGYKKIMVGAYGERWAREGRTAELIPFASQSINKALANPEVIGFELGGFYGGKKESAVQSVDFEQLQRLRVKRSLDAVRGGAMRVGLLASRTNFDFWHGERSNDRNVHQDALVQAYALLSSIPDLEVRVIGDRVLSMDPDLVRSLDAIFVPHQVVLSSGTKERLRNFWLAGGVLIQDMRLGEFTADGVATGDWLHDVFGIQDVRWSAEPARFVYQGEHVDLDMQAKVYVNHALLRARPGYEVRAGWLSPKRFGWVSRLFGGFMGKKDMEKADPDYGLVLRGERSLVFGCLPQLVEGPSASTWRRIFVEEVTAVVARHSNQRKRTAVRAVPHQEVGMPVEALPAR